MPVSPYEWNESIRQRNEYIDERLKEGSPVIGISYDNGILLFCLRGTQRKIFEVYDRLMFSAVGNQADIETIRTGAVDVAHREGFNRSPEDVSVQRIVGFAVSPSIKKVYSDAFAAPVVIRAVFAELGKSPDKDQYFVVGYDGEFTSGSVAAVIAGTIEAEEKAQAFIAGELEAGTPNLSKALDVALAAWGVGRRQIEHPEGDEDGAKPAPEIGEFLGKHVTDDAWRVEAAILERDTPRESKFRALREDELRETLAKYR